MRVARFEAGFGEPGLELLVGEHPAVLGGERHVDREERRERRRGAGGVGHHVEDEEPAAWLQRARRAAEDVHDCRGRLLMERTEDRDRVVPAFAVVVRVVVAGAALDAPGEAELRHVLPGALRDRRQVHGDALERGVGLAKEDRVGAGPAREVEEPSRKPLQHRHHPAPDAHRAPEHRVREDACARGVAAEVQLRALHRAAGARELGELAPRRIDVAVVADRAGEVGWTARDERRLTRRRVRVLAVALLQQPQRDARVRKKPHPARARVQLAALDLLEHAAVDGCEQHRAPVERARQINYSLYVLHCQSFPWRITWVCRSHRTQGNSKIRQYADKDIETVRLIHNLVKVRGFKISSAKKILAHNPKGVDKKVEVLDRLLNIRSELQTLKKQLDYLQ